MLCCYSGEQPLQVARCTKIINADTDDPKYIINVKQFAKFVVDLSDQVAPTDIEEGMRVGLVAVFPCNEVVASLKDIACFYYYKCFYSR